MTARHLVVVDMQEVFADPSSAWAAPGFAGILPAVVDLVKAFGNAVTFTRFVAPMRPAGAWRSYYDRWPFAVQPPEARLWDLVEPLERLRGEVPTVDRTTFSKWGPALAERVGDATLVLAGVSTDCCVLSTAVAAADAGVPVQVMARACAGSDDTNHRMALGVLALYAPLIEVIEGVAADEFGRSSGSA